MSVFMISEKNKINIKSQGWLGVTYATTFKILTNAITYTYIGQKIILIKIQFMSLGHIFQNNVNVLSRKHTTCYQNRKLHFYHCTYLCSIISGFKYCMPLLVWEIYLKQIVCLIITCQKIKPHRQLCSEKLFGAFSCLLLPIQEYQYGYNLISINFKILQIIHKSHKISV